jgi:hypothetical protein
LPSRRNWSFPLERDFLKESGDEMGIASGVRRTLK